MTYRVIEGADHGLSEERWQQAYTSLLVNWATEMVLGAREGGAGARGAYAGQAVTSEGTSTPGLSCR